LYPLSDATIVHWIKASGVVWKSKHCMEEDYNQPLGLGGLGESLLIHHQKEIG
jgi:hypothetical protein